MTDWPETRDRWPDRIAAVAALVPRGASVLDVGAGAEGLRSALGPGHAYTPLDLPAFDMNTGPWPEGRWGVVTLVGVLEYARRPRRILRAIRPLAPRAILTYDHDGEDPAYVNRLTEAELSRIAAAASWRIRRVGTWRTGDIRPQTIWRLS